MQEFYYYYGDGADLISSSTKYLYAQYYTDLKVLHVCAAKLEQNPPFGWAEYIVYDLEPSFKTFHTLKGTGLVPLKDINHYISASLNYWELRDRELIEQYAHNSDNYDLRFYVDLAQKVKKAKKEGRAEIGRRLTKVIINLKKANS